MAHKRDYYEVLGLSKGADEQSIKKAYRRLAHEHHPDKNAGDKIAEERFKEIAEAYAVLSDAQKRAQYDRFGHQAFGEEGVGVNINDIFGEFFGDIFGGAQGGRRRGRRGQDGANLSYELDIKFEEAAFGVEKEIYFKRREACASCHGSGAKEGSKPSTCKGCRGSGEIRVSQGFFAISQTCPECRGSGEVVTDRCTVCRGALYQMVNKELKVKIPEGIEDGMQIRVGGYGEGGILGGRTGDLYVLVRIKPHSIFKRQGNDVLCEVPISFAQAALGAKLDVPTLDGMTTLEIPAGTASHTVFRLRQKGIPALKQSGARGRGDELVSVRVEVPRSLTDQQKELLRDFDALSKEEDHPEGKGFFEKVKELFC